MRLKPLTYSCTACGTCCRWGGWACLYPADIPRLAAFLGLSEQAFVDTYTRHILVEYQEEESILRVPYLALLAKDGACIFLEGPLCKVHAAKPIHCSESPFLAEFLLDREGYELLAKHCPGLGKGQRHSLEALRAHLDLQADRDEAYAQALEAQGWDLAKVLGLTLPEPEFIPDLGLDVALDDDDEQNQQL